MGKSIAPHGTGLLVEALTADGNAEPPLQRAGSRPCSAPSSRIAGCLAGIAGLLGRWQAMVAGWGRASRLSPCRSWGSRTSCECDMYPSRRPECWLDILLARRAPSLPRERTIAPTTTVGTTAFHRATIDTPLLWQLDTYRAEKCQAQPHLWNSDSRVPAPGTKGDASVAYLVRHSGLQSTT